MYIQGLCSCGIDVNIGHSYTSIYTHASPNPNLTLTDIHVSLKCFLRYTRNNPPYLTLLTPHVYRYDQTLAASDHEQLIGCFERWDRQSISANWPAREICWQPANAMTTAACALQPSIHPYADSHPTSS